MVEETWGDSTRRAGDSQDDSLRGGNLRERGITRLLGRRKNFAMKIDGRRRKHVRAGGGGGEGS